MPLISDHKTLQYTLESSLLTKVNHCKDETQQMHYHEFHHKSPKAFNLWATLLSSHTIQNAVNSYSALHEDSLCGSSEDVFAFTMSYVNRIALEECKKKNKQKKPQKHLPTFLHESKEV